MADLTITAANVLKGANSTPKYGTAGEALTAGEVVYKDASDSYKLKKADNNASVLTADGVGITLNGGGTGQPIAYIDLDDDFTPGATLAVNTAYVLSGTAGKICPIADLTTGMYGVFLFWAKTTTKAKVNVWKSGVATP